MMHFFVRRQVALKISWIFKRIVHPRPVRTLHRIHQHFARNMCVPLHHLGRFVPGTCLHDQDGAPFSQNPLVASWRRLWKMRSRVPAFLRTSMYWPVVHYVSPQKSTLSCSYWRSRFLNPRLSNHMNLFAKPSP